MRAEWVYVIVKALEARLEYAEDSGELDHEIPSIMEALRWFREQTIEDNTLEG
jgi:hypothetical protein